MFASGIKSPEVTHTKDGQTTKLEKEDEHKHQEEVVNKQELSVDAVAEFTPSDELGLFKKFETTSDKSQEEEEEVLEHSVNDLLRYVIITDALSRQNESKILCFTF